MGELSPVAVGVVVVVAVVGAVPVAASTAGQQATPDGTTTATNASLAPGEQLAAVVNVQQVDIEAEIGARSFGHQVAGTASNTSKAGVVKAEVDALRDRLVALSEEKQELRAAHRNGSLSNGKYRAELASLHAKTQAIERRLNGTEHVARGLPAEALEAKDIDAGAIRSLKSEARNLTGPDVAAIARQIAGKNAGKGLGADDRGPPAFVDNRTGGPGNGQGPPANASEGGERGPPDNRSDANENRGQPMSESSDSEDRRPSANESDDTEDRGPPANNTSGSDVDQPPDTPPGNTSSGGSDERPADSGSDDARNGSDGSGTTDDRSTRPIHETPG